MKGEGAGECIALAIYHLKYILGMGQAGLTMSPQNKELVLEHYESAKENLELAIEAWKDAFK